jgi:hypothetical protein
MLPKKNTSVATLALVFSLAAVPRAIAGSPFSLGSTLTQPAAAPNLPVVHSHQPKGQNLMLKKPFDDLSATIHVASAQANPNLPRKAQSQSWNGLWAMLPILGIFAVVWGWYRSQSSQENSAANSDQSNLQQDSDRTSTPLNQEEQLSDEVTPPQTVVSENKTEISDPSTAVPADTITQAEMASLTDSAAATGSGETDPRLSNTNPFDTVTTPAVEDRLVETPPTDSASPQGETRDESREQTTDSNQPRVTVPEEAIPAEPPKVSPVQSDPVPSFNETQFSERTPSDIEAAKFNLGQTKPVEPQLASVDEGLAELPNGYGKTKIVLMPREPNSAYAYWDIPNEDKEKLRKQGGEQLALRFYDVTGIDMDQQKPHSVRQYDCEEMTREWYIDVPISDRDYIVEIGYVTEKGHWLRLARSLHVRIPPVYPCDWYGDDFRTVNWENHLSRRE